MRVAVVDIGTNSTRLLIADVHADGRANEILRRSKVTRLGDGVDSTGLLSRSAIERTLAALATYRRAIDDLDCAANIAVLTSAVRDASNGAQFRQIVIDDFALHARTLTGEQEARLTFLGAMSGRSDAGVAQSPAQSMSVVIDIGGGSTELVAGRNAHPEIQVSTQAGVVRMSERHIRSDPPGESEIESLTMDCRTIFAEAIASRMGARIVRAIAVAGTATSAAAIEQRLDPYDPARVHGYVLSLESIESLRARLSRMSENERARVVGLHPDRAPTILAGMVLLAEVLKALDLEHVEVSEHDLLLGAALTLARASNWLALSG